MKLPPPVPSTAIYTRTPRDTPLLLRSGLELRALLPEPRDLCFFAGSDKGALRIGDFGCCRLAGGQPGLCRVEVIPA